MPAFWCQACSASTSDWPGAGQHEIDHHRRAAGEPGARAGEEIVGGVRAHEGHFQVRVRVDAARHDVAAGGVEHVVVAGRGSRRSRRSCRPRPDVGRVGDVGGDDRAALDDVWTLCSSARSRCRIRCSAMTLRRVRRCTAAARSHLRRLAIRRYRSTQTEQSDDLIVEVAASINRVDLHCADHDRGLRRSA